MVLVVRNPPANEGDIRDVGSIPELGRSPGGGHGNPLQYSCLENPMDIGAWSAILHGVAELATTEVTEHRHTNFLKTKTPENLGNCAELPCVLASILQLCA